MLIPTLRHGFLAAAAAMLTLAGLLPATAASAASAASVDEAQLDNPPAGEWLSQGRDHDEQRYSPLKQINDHDVQQLGLAWYGDFDTRRGQESTPLVIGGKLYVTTAWSKVYAYDARTGKQLWKYDPQVPGQWGINSCCDVVNRGLAAWEGKLYLGTLDGRLIALDAATGKPVWSSRVYGEHENYAITGAPRVANGRVFIGEGGSEYEMRGFISAFDAGTGKPLWKWWIVPGDPSKGFEQPELAQAAKTWKGEWWKKGGGGSPWDGMAYDAVTDSLIFGSGNGAPWPSSIRSPADSLPGNENLFVASIIALDARTGRYKWHYQATPYESWDFDATQPIMLADLTLKGQKHRVAMQANKNGMFYILDAKTGKLLSGKAFVPDVNWNSGIDEKTGRPKINPKAVYTEDRGFVVIPAAGGAHSWHPMSYNPGTGLVYIPTNYANFALWASHDDDNPIGQKWSVSLRKAQQLNAPNIRKDYLLAWDPVKGKEVWRAPISNSARAGGTLSTAGNLVFAGSPTAFSAWRADNGQKLWSFEAQTGVVAGAVSYAVDGEQYIAVVAGVRGGGNYYSPNYSRILAFKLGGTAKLPAPTPPVPQVLNPPAAFGTAQTITQGGDLYNRSCAVCHGSDGENQSRGMFPDLRYSAALGSPELFGAIVRDGALTQNGMVSFKSVLTTPAQLESVRAYLVSRALYLKAHPQPPAPPQLPGQLTPLPAPAAHN